MRYLGTLFALAALTTSCQGCAPAADDHAASAAGLLPENQYFCQGHEGGLIASIGSVTFLPGGGFLDQAYYGPSVPAAIGNWSYDPHSGRLTFSENLDFAYGVFDGAHDRVTLYWRVGVSRAHAEGGGIECFRGQS